MSGRSVLIAAGGTGGHLFPAAALAAALSRRGVDVDLATDDRARKYGADFFARAIHVIPSATTTDAGLLNKALATLILARGLAASIGLIRRLKPSVVVGFGGYPTVPPLVAAWLLGVPSVLHEQNAVIGRANKFLARRATLIATGFPDLKGVDKARTRYVGNPVRPAVIAAAAKPYPARDGGRLRVLITGGSQGARVFSDIAPAALALLTPQERARLKLTQQARGEDLARVAAACAKLEFPLELAEFFTDLPARIADAHLVIARAGASTVSELAVIGRPSLLAPFPHALDQDQAMNAAALAASGGAKVIDQREFTPQRLAAELRAALNEPERLHLSAVAAKSVGVLDAAERLADVAMEVARV